MKRRKRVAKRLVRCFSEAENNHLEKSLGPGYLFVNPIDWFRVHVRPAVRSRYTREEVKIES